jgi:hypothetical protein
MEIKIFQKQKNFKKNGFVPNPTFYWNLILVLAFVIILVTIVWGFIFFQQISTDSGVFLDDVHKKVEVVDSSRIKKTLEYFQEREKESAKIINSPSPISDPSI